MNCVIPQPSLRLIPRPKLLLQKSASPLLYNTVGQEITYEFIVTNLGNVPIRNIVVTDSNLGVVATVPVLFGTAPERIFVSYFITQADIDAGSITNTAFAVGDANPGLVRAQSNPVTIEANVP